MSETVLFGASSNSSNVSVVVVNDDVLENEEEFIVTITASPGQQRVDFTSQNARVFINSDDGMKM